MTRATAHSGPRAQCKTGSRGSSLQVELEESNTVGPRFHGTEISFTGWWREKVQKVRRVFLPLQFCPPPPKKKTVLQPRDLEHVVLGSLAAIGTGLSSVPDQSEALCACATVSSGKLLAVDGSDAALVEPERHS